MKHLIAVLVVLGALFVPSVASAHTGSVTCTAQGVVFTYNANFPVTENAFEKVDFSNGAFSTKNFTVVAGQVTSDTIPVDTAGTVVASSTWAGGGSIPPTSVTCPSPDLIPGPFPSVAPPPVTPVSTFAPPIVCPAGTTPDATGCVKIIAKCPKGTKQYSFKYGVLICVKTHIKVIHKIKLIPYTPVCPPNKSRGGGGVTG